MLTSGFNICGCATSAHGIAEALRGFIRAAQIAQIPYVVNNIGHDKSPETAEKHGFRVCTDQPYGVNCLYFNPSLLEKGCFRTYGRKYLEGRHNVGFWYWEADKLRPSWLASRHHYQEIWAGSEYCRQIFEHELGLPTAVVPPVVAPAAGPAEEPPLPLPRDCFVVLCCYDYRSCVERKNPVAAIEAFQQAFPGQTDVRLVLKARTGGLKRRLARAHRRVKRRAGGWWPFSRGDQRILFLEDYLSAGQLRGLLQRCNCLISLHRSEGFGLHLAEALYLERPVVATGYSGNMDFMHEDNSYPVGYDLVPIRQRSLPYPRGSRWAEPDVAHAAELLRHVYSHPDEAQAKARRGAAFLRQHYSAERVGEILRGHLNRFATGPYQHSLESVQ